MKKGLCYTVSANTQIGRDPMTIITEDMRFRKRLCDFAQKHGVINAARRYKTNRMFVYRQLARFDGSLESLRLKSTKPNSHPNQHTSTEKNLIKKTSISYKSDGLAEVYVQLRKRGYLRSYGSMCVQIRKMKIVTNKTKIITRNRKHKEVRGAFPGDKVQVDIKYVPQECIAFNSYGKRYYQITAIDEFTRKRVLYIVDEKNVTHTSNFVLTLERKMGFKIVTVQTDNGAEFINTSAISKKLSQFELTLEKLGIKHVRTQPYSPWQNGKVERSHRLDNDRLYSSAIFKSVKHIKKRVSRYNSRYNNIHTKVLGFMSPNEMVLKYKHVCIALT